MHSLLYWSDCRQLYLIVAYGGALVLFLLASMPAFLREGIRSNSSSWIYPILLGLWMVATRWPGLFYYLPFDPDEAQIVAAAQTLATEPVLYRMADGASSGPLTIYFAGIPWIFGAVPSLFVARLIAVLFGWAGVLAIYWGLKCLGNELAARLGALSAALFYGFTSFWNYVHYNSEMLPSALCAWGTALLISMFCMDSAVDRFRLEKKACMAALLLSMVPFSKLQLVPLALMIGLLVYLRGAWILRGEWRHLVRYTALLAISAVIFPSIFFLFIYLGGSFHYFFQSYIANNLLYAGSGYSSRLHIAGQLIKTGDELVLWGGGILLITLIMMGLTISMGVRQCGPRRLIVMVCIALAGTSAYCVLAPSRDYIHYLLLLPMPLSFAFGAVLAWTMDLGKQTVRPLVIGLLAPPLLIVSLLPYLFLKVKSGAPWAGSASYWSHKPPSGIAAEIINRAHSPKDGLLVWGYEPGLHVTTGVLQISRLSITSPQIQQNALTPFYRQSLMEDLALRPPRFIVDAVCDKGFIFTDHALYGPHCFPEFNDFLKSNYQFVGNYSGMTLYERKYN